MKKKWTGFVQKESALPLGECRSAHVRSRYDKIYKSLLRFVLSSAVFSRFIPQWLSWRKRSGFSYEISLNKRLFFTKDFLETLNYFWQICEYVLWHIYETGPKTSENSENKHHWCKWRLLFQIVWSLGGTHANFKKFVWSWWTSHQFSFEWYKVEWSPNNGWKKISCVEKHP